MTDYDAIIIGAGYGGLSIASLLSRKGARVLVLEALNNIGGRARVIEKDGVLLDYGIHAHRLAGQGPAAQVIRRLGEEIAWCERHHGELAFTRNGRLAPVPDTLGEILKFDSLSPTMLLRFIKLIIRISKANNTDLYRTSLDNFAGDLFDTPDLQNFLKLLASMIMALDPVQASAGEFADLYRKLLEAGQPTGAAIGGEKQLFDKMLKHLREPSAVRTGTVVRNIIFEKDDVRGVVLSGGEIIRSKTVIYSAPIQQLFRVADAQLFPPAFRARATGLSPTSALSVDIVSHERPELPSVIVDVDLPLMARMSSNSDPTLAEPGKHLSTWLIILENERYHAKDYILRAKRKLAETIARLAPEVWRSKLWDRWIGFPILDGAHLRVGQSWVDRLPLQSQNYPGLFFVGDTSRAPGVGGDVAFQAALWAEPLILQHLAGELPPPKLRSDYEFFRV